MRCMGSIGAVLDEPCTGQQGTCLADATGGSVHGQGTHTGTKQIGERTNKQIQGKWKLNLILWLSSLCFA